MPLFHELPADVPAMCAAIDLANLRPAEKALHRREVQARIDAGDRPDKLVPLACVRGKFKMGRFVDEDGNLYRLSDVALLLDEVPETRGDMKAFRRARAVEAASVAAVFATSPGLLVPIPWIVVPTSAAALATNSNGSAKVSLARAVMTYNATTFWEATQEEYAPVNGVPTAVVRETELLYAARGCIVDRTNAQFADDAEVVWGYAKLGYDASALMQAAETAPASYGCELAEAVAAGLVPTQELPPLVEE